MNTELIIAVFSLALAINVFLCVWFIRISENRTLEKISYKQTQIDFLEKQITLLFKSLHDNNERLALTQGRLDIAFKEICPNHITVPKFRGQ